MVVKHGVDAVDVLDRGRLTGKCNRVIKVNLLMWRISDIHNEAQHEHSK